jgi:peptidoglycan hydrolase-like protein with peptidoglycan-binding domain
VLAGTAFLPVQTWAQGKTGDNSAKKTASVKKESSKPAAKRKVSSRSRKRGWRTSYRYRLSRLKLEPQRVQEIQQALVQAGYLTQESTGKWDDPTRNAMRRYQADNGFPTTGLPEAKSLMKLGLGPHPLPQDCDPTAEARTSSGALAQPDTAPTPPATPNPSLQQDK